MEKSLDQRAIISIDQQVRQQVFALKNESLSSRPKLKPQKSPEDTSKPLAKKTRQNNFVSKSNKSSASKIEARSPPPQLAFSPAANNIFH